MDTLSFKTVSANKATAQKEWVVVDAAGQSLGRVCSKVAKLLRGKYKPNFTPHVDCGDNVIIINADKVVLTAEKASKKKVYRHSGFPGGIKSVNFNDLMQRHPTRAVELAVKGMLPKGPLGRAMYRKLKVYAGAEHPHASQSPKTFEITQVAQ